ncbi:MAG: ABC transporter substrate-binding protein [Treponema sp.]|jgi:peptide/nickel transport system substrate-binding protein|nr:ABC transporter substrate-binding protein [Treponema sp.]
MMDQRISVLLFIIALGTGCLTGCGTKKSAASSPAEQSQDFKDTFVAVLSGEPTSLDPASSNSLIIGQVLSAFCDPLLRENPDGTIDPCLAVSWEILDDTSIRFHLRQGVKFHNGNAFTAEDVLYSFARAKKNPLSASTFQYFDTDNSKIIDDYTLELKLIRPYAPIFNTLSGGRSYIVDKEYIETVGDAEAARNPVGTGPYKFVNWVSGSEIRGVRNDDYWNTLAATPNVVYKFIAEAANRVIELETGNADLIYDIDPADKTRVEELPNAHVETGSSYRYYCITFSMQDPVLADKDLRYALSYAIDKEALVKAVFGDTAVAANGFYPSVSFAFKETGILPYDQNEAKRLLTKAGYPNGLTLKLNYGGGEIDSRIVEVIQNMWKQIGVELEIYPMNSQTYLAGNNKFQVGMRSGNAEEPSNILIIYDSAFADKLQGNDDKLDKMLHDAMAIYDSAGRFAAYQEIQDYLFDMRYTVPLAFTDAIYGVSDKVKGFVFHPGRQFLHKYSVAR